MKIIILVFALFLAIPAFGQDRKERRLQRRDAKVTFVGEQKRVHRQNFPNKRDTRIYRLICIVGVAAIVTAQQNADEIRTRLKR